MSAHPISTFNRVLYLNFWAFFLLILGVVLAILPIYKLGMFALILQIVTVALFFKGALSIFRTWQDKKRKYFVLIERNRNGLRPDTFGEYMKAPCGRLLVKVVLADLGMRGRYRELQYLKNGFWSCKRSDFKRPNAVIRINSKYL